MGLFSSISGLLSGAASGASSFLGGIANSAFSAKQQYRYGKKFAENAPSWNVKGLRNAGLNPVLAANPSGGTPSAGISPAAPVDFSGQVEKLSSAKMKRAQTEVAENQKKITENQAISSAADANMKTMQMNWQTKTYDHMMNQKGGFLMNLAALKKAGFKGDIGDAIAAGLLMTPNSAKTVDQRKPKEKSAPHYMGIPIWR